MALCQLHCGFPPYAIKLCTKALELAPSDSTILAESQEEVADKDRKILRQDVEKVLYRRALASVMTEDYEAGIEDANRLLLLNPSSKKGQEILKELQNHLREHNAALAKLMKKAFQ